MELSALLIVLLALISGTRTTSTAAAQALPGCHHRCGNVTVPYPFGIGDGCFLEEKLNITCVNSEAYLGTSNIRVTNIFLHSGELQVLQFVARDCYKRGGAQDPDNYFDPSLWVDGGDFTISATKNKFTAIGCDTTAIITGYSGERRYTAGCLTVCYRREEINFGSCEGVGCCQITSIPSRLKNISISLSSDNNHTYVWDFNPCSYAILAEETQFQFSNSSFEDFRKIEIFPLVLDWAVGNVSCDEARRTRSLKCMEHSKCVDSNATGSGYLCQCLPDFEGNPYLPHGCQDIDECKNSNPCINGKCRNLPGSFNCSCPKGYTNNSASCIKGDKIDGPRRYFVYALLSVSTCLIILIVSVLLYWGMKKRKMIKLKEKFFVENGGLMLQQLSCKSPLETTKIFSEEELRRATNNYHESRVLGEGGYGTVYKGILQDQRTVAIKTPKIGAKIQIKQFINEVNLLMQINHRNVLRLLGCCLETKVPLLVYECISNGTLFHHIHDRAQEESPLTLELRLKIATETAEALAYLHSEIYTPIIHRDVKTANILLDANYTAKVSDFGASRLIPLDEDQMATFVQGTFGYLDPEYMHSSQLTEKSDVYSFGVVLTELLTSRKAVSFDRSEMEYRNLAMCFVSALKEDRLFEILDNAIVNEDTMEVLKEVANIAENCLRVKGEERPSMKEVAAELEGLRKAYHLCPEPSADEPGSSADADPYCIDVACDCSSGSSTALQNELLNYFGDEPQTVD